MNYFFALEVPQEVQQHIQSEAVILWKPALMEIARWYAPEDYHVTLKFLSNVKHERQQELIDAGKDAAVGTTPFSASLAPSGSFPSDSSKRIFWVGIRRSAKVSDLARCLDEECHRLGFGREQRLYIPHLTVARYPRRKGSDTSEVTHIAAEHSFPFWQVTHLVPMQTLPLESRAKDSKSRYNIVRTFPFGVQPELKSPEAQGEIIG